MKEKAKESQKWKQNKTPQYKLKIKIKNLRACSSETNPK